MPPATEPVDRSDVAASIVTVEWCEQNGVPLLHKQLQEEIEMTTAVYGRIMRAGDFKVKLDMFLTYLTVTDGGRDGEFRESAKAVFQCLDRHALLVRGQAHDAAAVHELKRQLRVSKEMHKKEQGQNGKRKNAESVAERNREKNLRQAVAKLEAENSTLALDNGKLLKKERDARTRMAKAVAENSDLLVELTTAKFEMQFTERKLEETESMLDCTERKLSSAAETIDLRSEEDEGQRGRGKSARAGRQRRKSAPPPSRTAAREAEPPTDSYSPPRSDPPNSAAPTWPTWGKPDRRPPTPALDSWGTLRPQPRSADHDRRPHRHTTPGWEGYVAPANPKSEASGDSDSGNSDASAGGAEKRQRYIQEQGQAIEKFKAKMPTTGTHLRFKSPAKTPDDGSSSVPSTPAGTPPFRPCPICVEGSGKEEGHRGRHRRAPRTGN
jgi:hypothetical protein